MVHTVSYDLAKRMYFTGFSEIKDPRHTGREMLGSELGSAHVDNLEAITDESALDGVRSRPTSFESSCRRGLYYFHEQFQKHRRARCWLE